jgi:hypothetical protein
VGSFTAPQNAHLTARSSGGSLKGAPQLPQRMTFTARDPTTAAVVTAVTPRA